MNFQYQKKIYIYKTLYLIRINLPSSEYIYIIMFFIKYLGLIITSISLNEMKNNLEEEPNQRNVNDKSILPENNEIFIVNFKNILSKFLITGSNLNILNNYYQEICLTGFCLLMIYISLIIFGFIYMSNEYSYKNINNRINKKILKINNNSKFEKIYIKIMTYIFFLICFFHQYIIEYYFFGFFGHILYFVGLFDSDTFVFLVNSIYIKSIGEYIINMRYNPIFILIINLIVIIIILLLFIFFMLINSTKSLFINIGNPFCGNNTFMLCKILIFTYNSICIFINMFDSNITNKIILILNIISFIIIFSNTFLSFYNFSYYPSNLCHMCLFIEFFSFFSIITDILIFLTNSQVSSTKFKLAKLFIEILNAIVISIFYIYKKEEHYLKIFSMKLFSEVFEKLYPDDIYYYMKIFIKYSENENDNYMKIFRIIQKHILSCNKEDCPCKSLIPKSVSYSLFTNFTKNKITDKQNEDIYNSNNITTNEEKVNDDNNIKKISETSYIKSFEINNLENLNRTNKDMANKNIDTIMDNIETKKPNYKKIKTYKNKKTFGNNELSNTLGNKSNNYINNNPEKYEKRKLLNKQFQMIGEQEIINRINFLYKRKRYFFLEIYIFIHLQYLIKIKQNYRLALYFTGKYSSSGVKFSFLTNYFLYEIKKYISKSIIQLKNVKLIKDPYIIKYQQENASIKKLVNYLYLYPIIKKLLKISCEKIIYFYSFRNELHNSLSLQKYTKSKIYPIIKSVEEIKSSLLKLKFLIEKYNKEEKHPIESTELSYLICNLFKLINGKIPQDILKNITPILYFKKMNYDNLENEYHDFMMNNPLIIALTRKDTFNILYFTNIFLNKLGYNFSDLKYEDFHEKLFPGGQELIREHTIMMKQFLFFYKNNVSRDNVFLKSKEGYLVPISFSCRTFPTFSDDFLLISNIIFKEDSTFHKKGNNNFNINNNYKYKIKHSYSFLLNYEYDIYGMTKNFYEEYDLNQNMIRQLRLNFCQFFCIDENKLNEQIYKEKTKLLKKYPNFNHKLNLKELNKAYTIFQNISIVHTFTLREEKILENYLYPLINIYDKIDKKKLILKIPEIINIIDELGLDYDWYKRLQNYKNRLIYNKNIEKRRESEITTSLNFEKKKIQTKTGNRFSSSFDQIKLESNLINVHQQYLEVIYSVKKLGSIIYYIANLYEKYDDSYIINNQTPNEEVNEISKRDSIKKRIKKIGAKTTIKLNRNFSASPAEGELPISERENNLITKKSKTKVFFPQFCQKTNSASTPNHYNSITENQKSYEKPRKSDSKKSLKKIIEVDNIEKNEKKYNEEVIYKEKNKDKENINEYKDITGDNNDKNKIFDNSEYIKRMKSQKKEKDNFEDEENSPLITKDKFNKIVKKNNKNNKILIIIIFIIVIITLILNIIKFSISLMGFETSKNVLKTTIYLEMLKIDIYVMSILSITYCINENEKITSIENIHSEAKLKMKSTINDIKILQDQINIIINNKLCSGIIKIIQEDLIVYNLNEDWTFTNTTVDLMEELRSLSYKLYNLLYTSDSCDITNTFYIYENLNSKNYEKAKSIHKIFFYFLKNIFENYKKTFDKLSVECASTIQNLWSQYQNILFNLIIAIMILLFVFIFLYIIKICLDYSYYQLLFLYYYNVDNNQLKFRNQIYYLYQTIHEFNIESINYFEHIKSNPLNNVEDINRSNSNFIKNTKNSILINNKPGNESIINNIINSISNKKNNKRHSSSYIDINDKNKNHIGDKNSMNGSLLNGSLNGSSLLFLNNSNNNKIIINNNNANNSFIPNINEKEEKNNSKEESIDSLLSFSKKILPNSLKISLILIIFTFIVYIAFCFANIIGLSSENDIWKFAINLSMNILERIPKIMAMLIYSCLSVIVGKKNLIAGSPYNDNQATFFNYFEVTSSYYSKDIMDNLSNNFFGEILRDTLRINYNFNSYLFQETNNIFTTTRKWELLLREKGYFCINAAIGEVISFQEDYTFYNFTQEMNNYATLCKNDNTGIDESGAQLEIAYILEEITTKYIEFINYEKYNINLDQARENFFGSSDIRRIIMDMQLSLILYYNTISYAVNIDFENKNKEIINQQIMFSGLLLLINLCLIIELLISIWKNEKHKKLFGYFAEIPKIE